MYYSKNEILSMASNHFFGEGNAQLPSGNMLMVDEIPNLSHSGGRFGKGFLEAEMSIRPDHWFFQCHFKNDPVMPGCLGLDALWQLLGVYLATLGLPWRGRALGVGKVKFTGQIYPEPPKIYYRLDIKRIVVKPMPMGLADGVVILDGREIYSAEQLKVGLISKV